jgi:hypothetical protein
MEARNTGVELAFCGLVCSTCGAFTRGKCKGCHSPKPMHSRCLVKKCAMAKGIGSCAECSDFANLHDCKKLNNFISKMFGFVFHSDRIGNLETIRDIGCSQFLANWGEKQRKH